MVLYLETCHALQQVIRLAFLFLNLKKNNINKAFCTMAERYLLRQAFDLAVCILHGIIVLGQQGLSYLCGQPVVLFCLFLWPRAKPKKKKKKDAHLFLLVQ